MGCWPVSTSPKKLLVPSLGVVGVDSLKEVNHRVLIALPRCNKVFKKTPADAHYRPAWGTRIPTCDRQKWPPVNLPNISSQAQPLSQSPESTCSSVRVDEDGAERKQLLVGILGRITLKVDPFMQSSHYAVPFTVHRLDALQGMEHSTFHSLFCS